MPVTIVEQPAGGMARIQYTWVSDASGNASGATTLSYNAFLMRACFKPDAGGAQPTDLYDITVTDSDGFDVLNGLGANLSNAANVQKSNNDGLLVLASTKLTINVTNAGNAKGGVVILYLMPVDVRA